MLFILGDAAIDLAIINENIWWLFPAAASFTGAIFLASRMKNRLDVFDTMKNKFDNF